MDVPRNELIEQIGEATRDRNTAGKMYILTV